MRSHDRFLGVFLEILAAGGCWSFVDLNLQCFSGTAETGIAMRSLNRDALTPRSVNAREAIPCCVVAIITTDAGTVHPPSLSAHPAQEFAGRVVYARNCKPLQCQTSSEVYLGPQLQTSRTGPFNDTTPFVCCINFSLFQEFRMSHQPLGFADTTNWVPAVCLLAASWSLHLGKKEA